MVELADELAVALARLGPALLHCKSRTQHMVSRTVFQRSVQQAGTNGQLLALSVDVPEWLRFGRGRLARGAVDRGDDLIVLGVCLVEQLLAVLEHAELVVV